MKILFLGPPLSGKKTQAKLLKQQHSYNLFSINSLFDVEFNNVKLKDYKANRVSFPLELINKKINDEYGHLENVVFQNYPNTLHEACIFPINFDYVFYLSVSDDCIRSRSIILNGEGGSDIVKPRIDNFHANDERIYYFYKIEGNLIHVDGSQSILDINKLIVESITKC